MPRPDTGTRQKLIDTATDLLWTSSYGAVSVDDICKAAGVRKGSFYHYFPSKESLAIAAMEHFHETQLEPDLKQIFAANLALRDQVHFLAQAILAEQHDAQEKYNCVCGCPLAALASEMIGQEDRAIGQVAEEMFGKCRAYMTRAIASAVDSGDIPPCDPEQKSMEIHDYITGLLMMARIHNSLDNLEKNLEIGMVRILNLSQKNYTPSSNLSSSH